MTRSIEKTSAGTASGENIIRCFVGIAAADMALDAVLDATIAQWRLRPAMQDVRWTPRDFLHLTLAFMGAQSRDALPPLMSLLDPLLRESNAFPVSLTHCSGFPDAKSRILAALPVPAPPLMALQQSVASAVKMAGISLEDRPFLPHITLGRWARDQSFVGVDEPLVASGRVTAVSLYRSDTIDSRSHYTVIARWPLRAS